jgi:hypothetical protein
MRRSDGGGGQRPLFELYRALFLSNKFISYVAFYIGPIQTGFLRGVQGIVIPVKKSATGTENTGIRRIPAGIGNLARELTHDIHSTDCFGEFRAWFRMSLDQVEKLTKKLIARG